MKEITAEELLELCTNKSTVTIDGTQLKVISDRLKEVTEENSKLVEENKNINDKSKIQFIITNTNPKVILRNVSTASHYFRNIQQLLDQDSIRLVVEYNETKTTLEYIHLSDLEKKMTEYYNNKLIPIQIANDDRLNTIKKDYDYEIERNKKDIAKIKEYKDEITRLSSNNIDLIYQINDLKNEIISINKAKNRLNTELEFYKNRSFWSRLFNIKYKI